jgi:hypothetical protein
MSFSSTDVLTSVHLGLVASFYNIVKKKGLKLYYWNKLKSSFVRDLFDACKLNKIVPLVDDYQNLL